MRYGLWLKREQNPLLWALDWILLCSLVALSGIDIVHRHSLLSPNVAITLLFLALIRSDANERVLRQRIEGLEYDVEQANATAWRRSR